ncbi:MAG: DUF5658 family protein [Candidatus Bathyarchaeota archaeon]|nr:DUF5658 family protein [Candidatus Bathyarchaeota archaeon]
MYSAVGGKSCFLWEQVFWLFEAKYVSSLLLILMGSLDCLTTVIGILFFQTAELNPLLVGLINTNIVVFVAVKLGVTLLVGLLFLTAQETLLRATNKECRSFRFADLLLRAAFIGIVIFLLIVILNNVVVIAAAL